MCLDLPIDPASPATATAPELSTHSVVGSSCTSPISPSSPLSHNSQLGVPLSVWALDAHHDIALIESGLSHPGDMARLEACVAPTEGVLTHLGEAHLGNFQDADHLAKEKCTLFQGCTRVFMPAFLKGACEPHLRCPVVTWAFKGNAEETDAALVVDVYDRDKGYVVGSSKESLGSFEVRPARDVVAHRASQSGGAKHTRAHKMEKTTVTRTFSLKGDASVRGGIEMELTWQPFAAE